MVNEKEVSQMRLQFKHHLQQFIKKYVYLERKLIHVDSSLDVMRTFVNTQHVDDKPLKEHFKSVNLQKEPY